MKLILATRGSPLALTQSRWTAERLRALAPGLEVELARITTSGDVLAVDQWAAQGNKGLFVKEIEEALLSGKADIAVHSAKDLPAALPSGLTIAAYPRREDPRDVLIANGVAFAALPAGLAVGSASARRQLQLKSLRPDLNYIPIRGNVDTRLGKLAKGECAALVLAAAGLKRLGRTPADAVFLEPEQMVPAPGQGALAVEARGDSADVLELLRRLDDAATREAVECERAFMAAMGGGCRMPLGAYARRSGGALTMDVFYSPDESTAGLRLTGQMEDAPGAGARLAAELAQRMRAALSQSR